MQTPDIRVMLSHFHRQIELAHIRTTTQRPKLLHYDTHTGALGEFQWPCELNPDSKTPFDKVIRVAPGDLEAYRRTHLFRAPCCLCAFLNKRGYTEAQIAAVEVLTRDENRNRCLLNGEIVAQCAAQRCGYMVCLERFYQTNDLALRWCSERANLLPVQDLIHISDIEKSFRRGDGLFQVMPDIVSRGTRRGFQTVDASKPKEVDPLVLRNLMEGMAEDGFWTTFVQCMQCERVTFRQNYAVNHRCLKGKAQRTHPYENRYHPYLSNSTGSSTRTSGLRLLARMDTMLIGDTPEPQIVHSMSRRRASTASTIDNAGDSDDSHNYDPEDITIYDQDTTDTESISSADFSAITAQEDASDGERGDESVELDSDREGQPELHTPSVGAAGSWWEDDLPVLSSDDELPDILSIFEETTTRIQATSNSRSHV